MKNALRLAVVGGALAALILPMHSAGAAPSCQPGSGAKLAGHHLTDETIKKVGTLRCADLTGADLSTLDLTQADLTGVKAEHASFRDARLIQAQLGGGDLEGADFSGADLTQATLTEANLSGADLTNAVMGQADAAHVDLTGADLTNAHAAQAHLSGATLDGATVDGADFTQADLDGVSFHGIRGVTDWSLYLAVGAAASFVLIGGLAVARALGRRSSDGGETVVPSVVPTSAVPDTVPNAWSRMGGSGAATALAPPAVSPSAAFNPINPPAEKSVARGVVMGLLGALLVVFGLHLFVGGLLGQFSFAFDTLVSATCSGPQCAVGIDSGVAGLMGGIWVALIGGWTLARA